MPELKPIFPKTAEEVANEPLWWSPFLSLISPWFSRSRATQLHKAGLRCVGDARANGSFMSVEEAVDRYGFRLEERGVW